jgi:hypothetical protein
VFLRPRLHTAGFVFEANKANTECYITRCSAWSALRGTRCLFFATVASPNIDDYTTRTLSVIAIKRPRRLFFSENCTETAANVITPWLQLRKLCTVYVVAPKHGVMAPQASSHYLPICIFTDPSPTPV